MLVSRLSGHENAAVYVDYGAGHVAGSSTRKAMAAATSCGVPRAPSGMFFGSPRSFPRRAALHGGIDVTGATQFRGYSFATELSRWTGQREQPAFARHCNSRREM